MARPGLRPLVEGAPLPGHGFQHDEAAGRRTAEVLDALHRFLGTASPGYGETPATRRKALDAFLGSQGLGATDALLAEIAPCRGAQPDALTRAAALLLDRCEAWAFARRTRPSVLPVGAVVLPLNDALLALQQAHRACLPAATEAYRSRARFHLHEAYEALQAFEADALPGSEVPSLIAAVREVLGLLEASSPHRARD